MDSMHAVRNAFVEVGRVLQRKGPRRRLSTGVPQPQFHLWGVNTGLPTTFLSQRVVNFVKASSHTPAEGLLLGIESLQDGQGIGERQRLRERAMSRDDATWRNVLPPSV